MEYNHISTDADLNALHDDKRWLDLLKKVKENKDKAEEHLNKPLVRTLDTIYTEDQKYRMQMDEVGKKYGWNSAEMTTLWKITNEKDAINLTKVITILDTYGWLGPEEIGEQGNTTLFLVIQHADQKTQEKYLPLLRDAVKNKKAQASSLALLEDRVALRQGRKQIYGSQVSGIDGKYYLLPLEDPDNVDKKRAEVGLPPLAEYLSQWQIKWDIEQFKKNQESLEVNDNCGLVSLKINTDGLIEWFYKSEKEKHSFIVEVYKWNKWRKMIEVEDSGKDDINHYSCNIIAYHGENLIRIKHGNPVCVSDTLKVDLNIPEIKFHINKKTEEIEFNFETLYEITDTKETLLKKGYAKTIPINSLPKDNYILYYDNSIIKFKK